jgi:hypothetical protein
MNIYIASIRFQQNVQADRRAVARSVQRLVYARHGRELMGCPVCVQLTGRQHNEALGLGDLPAYGRSGSR